jgi:hypothetical protein
MLPKTHLEKLTETVYPTKRPKRTISVDTKKELILAKVAQGLSPSSAANAVGVKPRELKEMAVADETFSIAMADSYDQGTDYLEDLALLRAHNSDAVLIKLLEARRPEKFSNKRLITNNVKVVIQSYSSKNPQGGPITIDQPPPLQIEEA